MKVLNKSNKQKDQKSKFKKSLNKKCMKIIIHIETLILVNSISEESEAS